MTVERIGKYRVLAKLGQGGMARVMLTLAEGPHGFHKLLVVKELRDELVHDPEFLQMFLDEARLAARLNHPNIVQTYEVGNDGDRYFIAMEYLEGQPLNAVFRKLGRGAIPLELHLRMLADVCAGLDHAHRLADYDGRALGVVHRDISPQNVFLTYDGVVKLVDFGIAKASGLADRTKEGMLKGKISYIAPEQARCEPVDARADVFAVGVMLWEAIAGRRIVKREDEMSILARRMSGQDPRIVDARPDVPQELAEICDRAMAADPEDRFESARALGEVLEGYLAQSDLRVGPKDLARIVTEHFGEDREQIRAAVEEQVKRVDDSRPPIHLELHPASLKATSESLPIVGVSGSFPPGAYPRYTSDAPPSGTPSQHTQLAQALPPQGGGRSLLPAVGIGAGLAVAALVGVAVLTRTPQGAEPRAGGEVGATPQAPASDRVSLVIRYPQGARAKLDGGYVEGNPFEARVPKDGSLHRFEVELEGHETASRTITFDRDVTLDVALAPLATASASAPDEPAPVRPVGGGFRRPPPAASTAAPTAAPSVEVKKPPPASTVTIDENNPYRKTP